MASSCYVCGIRVSLVGALPLTSGDDGKECDECGITICNHCLYTKSRLKRKPDLLDRKCPECGKYTF